MRVEESIVIHQLSEDVLAFLEVGVAGPGCPDPSA
jgi:hypothetical protein